MKYFICSILLIFTTIISSAQDFIFSSYSAADFYINPALPGLIDKDIRVTSKFRGQWETFSNAYKTLTSQVD
jgi:hypothetical protein